MKLEELQAGAVLRGVLPGTPVTVVHVQWHGADVVELTYKDLEGRVANRLLFRSDEACLEIVEEGRPWSFDAPGDTFRLLAEAHRIRLAHLFDPVLAVHTSLVEPLPHQITAVYEAMLPRQPLRFLLADDPGAGKTIMAGLLIKELRVRGDLERCLIVCPGNLVEQWQDELYQRFQLPFEILTHDKLEAARTGNWFLETPLAIARLDKLSRNEDVQAKLAAPECRWDLIVVDEAHKMSATFFGGEIKYTKRYRLGRLLSGLTRHFLLMTATPHNGKEEEFQLFLALLDGDRFEGRFRDGVHQVDVSDLMRRMVKEKLVRFDGRPLFPERIAYTVPYKLSELEARLYKEVTEYVREEFNRADALRNNKRAGTVGFALTILQRRLASSPEAIYQSLHRRRQRLESRLRELELFQRANSARPAEGLPALEPLAGLPDQAGPGSEAETSGTAAPSSADGSRPGQPARPEAAAHHGNPDAGGVWIGPVLDPDDLADLEDAPETEVQQAEEAVLDEATAAASLAELRAEIAILRRLEALAARVRRSGVDTKWRELAQLLAQLFTPEAIQGELREEPPPYGRHDPPPPKPDRREKLVIFTEHRATLDYLRDRIATLLGRPQAVVAIHGGLGREERRKAQESFLHDPEVQVLVATDAAGEGINLQRAHFMVNYDLPWNPNRLEQRFGRIHRIGQTEVCYLWNLVATETREGDVYERLLEKLDEARRALGGQVFDVLGKLQFEGRSLKDLLIEAIRYGERPEVRARLHRAVENPFDHAHIRQLLEHRALAEETMDTSRLIRVREAMERAEARRLQPHYIESFFLEAFKRLGGAIREREPRRYEITHVPARIRRRDRLIGMGEPLLSRYERVVFEKELIAPAGKPMAAFVCPGHPLLQAVLDLTLEHHRGLLRRGAILVDERDPGLQPRLLVFLEHAIQDATLLRSGEPRTVSRRLLYVELARAATPEPASAWAAGFQPATNQDTQDGKGSGPTNDAGVLECAGPPALWKAVPPPRDHTPKADSQPPTNQDAQDRQGGCLPTKPPSTPSPPHSSPPTPHSSAPGSQPASDPPFLATAFHYAPYLDYRPLRPDEPDPAAILTRPEAAWLHRDLERLALQQALTTLVPEHLREVRERRLAWIEKTRAAVRDRLTKEIAYWDSRAEQLKLEEQAGKPNARLNSREARARADELAARLQRRLAELDRQAHLSASPPVVVGAALVVPLGLLHAIRGEPLPWTATPADTQTSAARARAIVMEIERSLGYEPVDREPEKLGYDIESRDPRTGRLRFLEVKGRVAGAPSLTVTRNEILTSLNKPDDYILAIVEFLDDGAHRVHYIRRPFQREPDFGVTSVNYSFAQLLARAESPA